MNKYITWAEMYIKHRDLFKKEIKHITCTDLDITVTKSVTEEKWILIENEDFSPVIQNVATGKKTWAIIPDSKASVKNVVSHWQELIKDPLIWIMFVDLSKNRHWALHPSTHAKIAEKNTLEQGLLSIHQGN